MTVTVDEMAKRWRRRQAERQARAEARARELVDRVPAAARLLRDRYGARRVVLFGSLARGTPNLSSDVDLAVEGIPPERYFTALSDLMGLFECPVDLVEVETASDSLLTRLGVEGQEL